MAKVKVWNKNSYPLEEVFMGDKIYIPANSWIAMEYDAAVMYKGQFKAPVLDHDGNDLPQGFKMVVIEPMDAKQSLASIAQESTEIDPLVCTVCRFKSDTKDALTAHLKEMHEAQAFSDPELDKEIESKRSGKKTKSITEEATW
jgi:hypothetical protein